MSMENAQPRPEPEGCLTAAVRIPVRIVVLVVVVPVRMVWDLLVVAAKALDRVLLRPVARAAAWLFRYTVTVPLGWLAEHVLVPVLRGLFMTAEWLAKALFVWPWVGLWRYVVVPVCRYGIGVPAGWLYRAVLVPIGTGLGHLARWIHRWVIAPTGRALALGLTGLGHALTWAGKALFVWPWVGAWRYVLVPVVRYGVVVPLRWLGRRVLVPLGRELLDALTVCWRIAGFVSRAVWRALGRAAWNLVGRPAAWFYRSVCTPVGHWTRDRIWAPARIAAVEAGRAARDALATARATVRQARRDAWHALVGGPRVTEPVEPVVAPARTLGSTTNASGAAPAPEISLRKQG
ncbi:hypothetical protein EAO71_13915 [Streptomyces sp. ms191]|uniref:hypothetical protein n=1 Tax=Streptomyces sp. ms191 TaxID=1827978 RepID=UPI0011CDFF34|nr:hypothetical protein [Streptomyces sp. ms191]TXS29722.1 hypothetical protein EAO71_13915 [Streptomyces sp. ms191]